ncbi:MAG TPA: polyphosphate kinase 1 [Polyangiaceae bacterium]|nr:polyphosphate kinase 1 [Polyangiaceae bacterium]
MNRPEPLPRSSQEPSTDETPSASSKVAPPAAGAPADASLFINRELSVLEFHQRLLGEAANPEVPLYERLKFLSFFSSNIDEFFMVRVAGLQAQLSGEIDELPPDGMSAEQQLTAISVRAHALLEEQYRIWNEQIRPELRAAGVALVKPEELAARDLAELDDHFEHDILPVLTPIAIDLSHPFPHVRNKSINVGVIFARREHASEPSFGVVQVPTSLPRLIQVELAGARRVFTLLEDLILRHLGSIFPQMHIAGQYTFRVTRNFDIEIDDEEGEDLLITLQAELRRRELGHAVRMGVSGDAPEESLEWLCRELGLHPKRDVYRVDGPLILNDMRALTSGDERRDLRDEPFSPQYGPPLRDSDDFFATIRDSDVLLHHPYESFEAVVDFLWHAAEDPHVLAIKQTLYRTGGESPMVRALQRAAEQGKQVTTVVELKARFDEASNIQWAQSLERCGVNVMYGLLGLKTHAKVLLVVRREASGLRRYVHLATGNYNQQTARGYEDLSLLTAREDIAEDATALFNLLTGYSAPAKWNRFLVAPLGLHEAVLGMIEREIEHARHGRRAGICAKLNAVVDADVIGALYRASAAGVPIKLLIRRTCCLKAGLPVHSERIVVRTIVDRFLEHARVIHFENGGDDAVYLTSADWMPRNFRRRVEVMCPILDESIKRRVIEEILQTSAADDVKSWEQEPDGSYARVARVADAPPLRAQQRFMELARERVQKAESGLGPRLLLATSSPETALHEVRRKGRKRRQRARKSSP